MFLLFRHFKDSSRNTCWNCSRNLCLGLYDKFPAGKVSRAAVTILPEKSLQNFLQGSLAGFVLLKFYHKFFLGFLWEFLFETLQKFMMSFFWNFCCNFSGNFSLCFSRSSLGMFPSIFKRVPQTFPYEFFLLWYIQKFFFIGISSETSAGIPPFILRFFKGVLQIFS